jgi:hypothetical protein
VCAVALPAVVQAQFIFTTNSGATIIQRYTGQGGDVTIPDAIDGFPVTCIGNYAFESTSVTSITIPNSVTYIGNGAFWGCSSLTSITIPNSVTNIGSCVFDFCASLTNITVDPQCQFYSSVDGVLFDKNQTTLVRYPEGNAGGYTIPNNVTDIAYGAFYYCTGLSSVTIPNSVSVIEGSAFMGSSLASVIIPDSVTIIEGSAFCYCTSLTDLKIGNGVTVIGPLAFESCTSLTSISIPDSVTSIADQVFSFCTSLANVTINNGVTMIGSDMFQNCTSLTNVTIGYGVTSIGYGALISCTSLQSVCFRGNAPGTNSDVFGGCPSATVYYLPGTTGWGSTYCGIPTALWELPYPLILNFGPNMGLHSNQFGFVISWANHLSAVVQACTNLSNPGWQPLQTNTLTGGSSYFSDPKWTNYTTRYYYLRSP